MAIIASLSEPILIGDDRVKRVPVRDDGEPLVDLLGAFPNLVFDLGRLHVQKDSASISFARREIGVRLTRAQEQLPPGLRLLVKECHRPLWVQKMSWDGYAAFLRGKFPAWSEAEIDVENSKLNAPLDVAPHATGGAVDLTLIDERGQWLDMGTEFNASPLETEGATYTGAANIGPVAQANRNILVDAMTSAGFVNYPTEWWHWSYGDKYWALRTGAPCAIYGPRDPS